MSIVPPTEAQARTDLAAAFRWAARLDWHESIANHFSVAISEDRCSFLMNPNVRHSGASAPANCCCWTRVTILRSKAADAPDPTAWHLHAQLHLRLPQARCILHTHMPYATALCCIKDFEWLMLDQNACRFHGRIAYDRHYNGMALNASEGARVAGLLAADKSVLMMGNHGVLVAGASVAEAFDDLYYLERAAKVQILALSTGRAPALIPEDVAARTCGAMALVPRRLFQAALRCAEGNPGRGGAELSAMTLSSKRSNRQVEAGEESLARVGGSSQGGRSDLHRGQPDQHPHFLQGSARAAEAGAGRGHAVADAGVDRLHAHSSVGRTILPRDGECLALS